MSMLTSRGEKWWLPNIDFMLPLNLRWQNWLFVSPSLRNKTWCGIANTPHTFNYFLAVKKPLLALIALVRKSNFLSTLVMRRNWLELPLFKCFILFYPLVCFRCVGSAIGDVCVCCWLFQYKVAFTTDRCIIILWPFVSVLSSPGLFSEFLIKNVLYIDAVHDL